MLKCDLLIDSNAIKSTILKLKNEDNYSILLDVTVIEPVSVVQVGCVTFAVGVAGKAGWALINTLPEAGEVHPLAFVTLNT